MSQPAKVLHDGLVIFGEKRKRDDILSAEDIAKLNPESLRALVNSHKLELIGVQMEASDILELFQNLERRVSALEKYSMSDNDDFKKGDKVSFEYKTDSGKFLSSGIITSLSSANNTANIKDETGVLHKGVNLDTLVKE